MYFCGFSILHSVIFHKRSVSLKHYSLELLFELKDLRRLFQGHGSFPYLNIMKTHHTYNN